VRLRAVLRTRDLPDAFPEAVLAESRPSGSRIPRYVGRRLDLRELALFTIDGRMPRILMTPSLSKF